MNECGMNLSHAYSVIKTFVLKDEDGTDEHFLYMIRDQKMTRKFLTHPNTKWNPYDTKSWTDHYR